MDALPASVGRPGENVWRVNSARHPRSAPEVSIVVPAYNEAERLPQSLPRLLDVVDWRTTELIIVDDGSQDATAQVAAELVAHLPRRTVLRLPANAGKGAAVRAGVARARGEATVFMDADMAADPAGLAGLLAGLDTAHVVVGSRAAAGAVVDDVPYREVMGRTFNRLLRAVTGVALLDTQCGFKAFRTGVAKLLFSLSQVDGFAFDVEVLALAQLMALDVAEVPISWTRIEGSHVRPVQDSLIMAADVVRLRRVGWSGTVPAVCVLPRGGRSGPRLDEVADSLRVTDPVFPVGRGTVALLPFVSGHGAAVVARRLRGSLPGFEIAPRALSVHDLAGTLAVQRPTFAPSPYAGFGDGPDARAVPA